MRCFILLAFLAFPVSAIAANAAADQSAAIAALTHEVQDLRAQNEKIAARLQSIEIKLAVPQLTFKVVKGPINTQPPVTPAPPADKRP
jgi:hypothetical protein